MIQKYLNCVFFKCYQIYDYFSNKSPQTTTLYKLEKWHDNILSNSIGTALLKGNGQQPLAQSRGRRDKDALNFCPPMHRLQCAKSGKWDYKY